MCFTSIYVHSSFVRTLWSVKGKKEETFHVWCGDLQLRDAFLNLFSIASSKDAQMVDVWDGGSWNPRFIRQLSDWRWRK